MLRNEPGRWLRRTLGIALVAQLLAGISLVLADRIRRLARGKGVERLPHVEPRGRDVGEGNHLRVFVSGAALYEDMLAAIARAEHRILLESYIIKGDRMGERFKRALQDASARGVDVFVIYDGFANLVVPRSFFDFGPGIEVLRFPVSHGVAFWNPRTWGRDHRKILVVDDVVGFVGGYNLGQVYADEWRDTHLSMSGPALWELENAFIDFWNSHHRSVWLESLCRPSWEPHVRAHRNVPSQLIFPIRAMYLEAIDRAHDTVEITQAYFIPDRNIRDALIAASQRGVRVRVLVPKVSNHVIADFVARGSFSKLLGAGIEILRYTDHMVHAKTMTVDGTWSTIGTANIDRLSLTGNYEINIEVLDPGFAEMMSEIFAEDAASAEVLDPVRWASRPRISRLYERVLSFWRPLV